MACGLMDHEGNIQYAITSENSRPSMRNSYGSASAGSYSREQRDSYSEKINYS